MSLEIDTSGVIRLGSLEIRFDKKGITADNKSIKFDELIALRGELLQRIRAIDEEINRLLEKR